MNKTLPLNSNGVFVVIWLAVECRLLHRVIPGTNYLRVGFLKAEPDIGIFCANDLMKEFSQEKP